MTPATMPENINSRLRGQLLDRRHRLHTVATSLDEAGAVLRLIEQIDDTLSRLEGGSFGDCQICSGRFDQADLLANPLAAYCLCELTPERQRALERDLQLAWRVQAALLPDPDLVAGSWQAHYRYLPFGPVSGDYCDLIPDPANADAFYFLLGDVSGKGVAASLLMSHLHAAFRAFVQTGLPLLEMVSRAGALLAGKSLASHYATLACGRAQTNGHVEIVNAGHCAPILLTASGESRLLPTGGLPIGLSLPSGAGGTGESQRLSLSAGDTLFLHTDGLTEAPNPAEEEYGTGRLLSVLTGCTRCDPRSLVSNCLRDLDAFLDGATRQDDLTLLAIRRS